MNAFPGNPATYCRKCEEMLGRVKHVDPEKYNLVPNEHGAIIRKCKGCKQLWLGWMQLLPNNERKIILKMIDKEL